MKSTQPRYDLPRLTWRALHSAFIDFVNVSPAEVGIALLNRVGGDMSFRHFVLAINEGRSLNVVTTIDEHAGVQISINVPVSDGPDWKLFTLDEANHGAGAEWLLAAGNFRIDEQLQSILGDA